MTITAATEYERPGSAVRPPQTLAAGGNGAARTSRTYYDKTGRRRTARELVPVDQYGAIAAVQFRCRPCKTTRWVPVAVAAKGIPVCEVDGRRMAEVPIRPPAMLLGAEMRAVVRGAQFRAVWALVAVTAVGSAAHRHVPSVALLAAAIPAGVLSAHISRNKLVGLAWAHRHLAPPNDRQRSRVGRMVGYCATVGFMWLALASHIGTDPRTVGGSVALTALVMLWLLPAATWWRWLRRITSALAARPVAPALEPDPEPDDEVPMDPDEAQTHRRWGRIVAPRKDAIVGTNPDGSPDKAQRAGRLVDTWLEDWHPVEGGWGATAVGPDGRYTGDAFLAAQGAIASAFKMKKAMVTVIPDGDDENRALILAQRTSPINEKVRWSGPDSIDSTQGTAPIARYADGHFALYEIYRPEWGSPHVCVFGTTGSGKSEFLNQMFTIDRWASYINAEGVRQGMVASFLIDPQQGQSFAPFLDDLAGPVAASLPEARLLVQALTTEMRRRNRYLAREAKTWDEKRKKWRKGRKWWNPLIDGPILTLTIDEAHDFLADREFSTLVTKGGRMWRKCGGQVRIATHTPLLADLGGSMALRDMLTGGFTAVFRTANRLTGMTAFNGRLPVDPCTIPDVPGSCYILTGRQPKPMLARAMFEDDYYDWLYDENDEPIGYPAQLPPETLAAFGSDYADWVQHAADPDAEAFTPRQTKSTPPPEVPTVCVDAVRLVLAHGAHEPMGMEAIDAMLRERGVTAPSGVPYSTRTVRDALAKLRKAGDVVSADNRHILTGSALANVLEQLAVAADGVSDAA